MNVAALITGGKDSVLALHRVKQRGFNVVCLVAMTPQRTDSWMFHSVNIHLAEYTAEAVGIPLVKGETSGVKEDEVEDLKTVLSTLEVEGVVSGAVSSQYQKKRIDRVCSELGFKSLAPLWQEDPVKLLREIVGSGFTTIIVGVYAHGFDESWLGRKLDQDAIADLQALNRKYGISPVGEGGEYETLVLQAPMFKKRIELEHVERVWENQNGYLVVDKAKLVNVC